MRKRAIIVNYLTSVQCRWSLQCFWYEYRDERNDLTVLCHDWNTSLWFDTAGSLLLPAPSTFRVVYSHSLPSKFFGTVLPLLSLQLLPVPLSSTIVYTSPGGHVPLDLIRTLEPNPGSVSLSELFPPEISVLSCIGDDGVETPAALGASGCRRGNCDC